MKSSLITSHLQELAYRGDALPVEVFTTQTYQTRFTQADFGRSYES